MNDRARGLPVLAHVLAGICLGWEVLLLVVVTPRHDQLINWSPEIAVFTMCVIGVGWVLAWKRPRMALGWLLLAIALLTTAQGPTAAVGIATLHSAPRVAAWMLWYGGQSVWAWLPPIGLLLTQLPLRFPDGRLPSPRWRWFSRYTIGAIVVASALGAVLPRTIDATDLPNPAYLGWGHVSSSTSILVALMLLGTSCFGSLVSLFVRYRNAGSTERTQLRWIFWAFAIVVGVLVSGWFENLLLGDDSTPGTAGVVARAWDLVGTLTYSLIPLSILFAVLRTGLYSIDRIISRTASYAVVSLGIIAVYFGVVVLLSQLLPSLPSVGVALATLTAAGVFLPLLRLVRRLVDRRFDRAQYDAEKVVTAFGERIRTGADPHTAGADLVDAVERTLQPDAIGLWTRKDLP
jgi:hypothetical protein